MADVKQLTAIAAPSDLLSLFSSFLCTWRDNQS
jgi:hypothetical protein